MLAKMMLTKAQSIGLTLGLVSLLLWFFLDAQEDIAERYYSRGFYPFYANLLSYLGNALPFAITGLLQAAFILWLLWIPLREFRDRDTAFSWLLPAFLSFTASLGLVLFLCCISFFYNHHRYSEEKLYGLDFEFTQSHYDAVVEHSLKQANRLSASFPLDERGCSDVAFSFEIYEPMIKLAQTNFLDSQGLPSLSRANGRYFLFTDIWTGMGISGQYQFLVAQPNLAKAIPEFYKPVVLAHERAHLNGFASEAGANLLASQTLLHSGVDRLRYLGLLELWRRNPPEGMNERVSRDVQCWADDWAAVREKRYQYDFIFTKMNDLYLKASGHPDGVQSYNRGRFLAWKYYYKTFVLSK